MALIIPPGFAQVALRFALEGDADVMITTFGVDLAESAEATAVGIAGAVELTWPAATLLGGWTFVGVRLAVGQDGGPPAIVDVPSGITGTGSTAGLPTNCAWLVTKQTALGGRQGRGRCYVPPCVGVEGDVDMNGVLSAPQRSGLQDAWDDIVAGVQGVILHDSTSPAQAPTPITSWVVDRQIATQRRRMRS